MEHRPQLREARPGREPRAPGGRVVPDMSEQQWFERDAALVQDGRLLRDPHPRLLRRERRRLRRLPRADRQARLSPVDRRRLRLAAADVQLAAARRRLRHRRLLLDPSRLRDGRRLPRVRRAGAPARHPRDRRPRHEPHLGRPPVVPGVARRPERARRATGTSGPTRTSGIPTRGSSSSTARRRTGRSTRCAASTTGTASSITSRISTTRTRRCRRRCSTFSASGSTSASTASGSTRCRTCTRRRGRTARTSRARTST